MISPAPCGVPRDALFYARLPDGALAPVVGVAPGYVRTEDASTVAGFAGGAGRYSVVLEVGRKGTP